MTRKLQFFLTALLLTVGVTSAWADDVVKTLIPSADTQLRYNNEPNYNTAEIETEANNSINYGFSGLLQFDLTEIKAQMNKGYRVKSVTLRLTNSTKQTRALTVKGISYTWNGTSKIKWSDISSTLPAAAAGTTLATVTMTTGEDAMCDLGKNKGTSDIGKAGTWNVASWQGTSVSSDAIVNYVGTAAGGNSNIMQLFVYSDDVSTTKEAFFSADVSSTTYNNASNNYTYSDGTGWSKMGEDNSSTRYAEIKKYLGFADKTDAELIAELVPTLTVTLEPVDVLNRTTNTGYSDLSTALSAVSANDVVVVRTDQEIAATTFSNALTLLAGTDGVKISRKSDVMSSDTWLTFSASAVSTIGSADYQLVFDGGNITDATKDMIRFTGTAADVLTNVKFQNYKGSYYTLLRGSANGSLTMKSVVFNNCECTDNNLGIIQNEKSSGIIFDGANAVTFTSCDGNELALKKGCRFVINSGATFPDVMNVRLVAEDLNELVLIFNSEATASTYLSYFNIVNESRGLVNTRSNGTWEYKTTEAYTLSIGSAGAATLVLPFTSTIPTTPSGLTCYKLTYDGGDNITATAESTTLAADKAVLVTGTADTKYKFVNTENVTSATTGTGQKSAYGVLIGNYDADYVVPSEDYILTNHSGTLGFRKADGSTNKVQAYRAYMDVTKGTPKSEAPAYLNIVFGGTTGISDIEMKQNVMEDENAPIYNLNGVRMNSQNLPKGIYVKNGRKFIVNKE